MSVCVNVHLLLTLQLLHPLHVAADAAVASLCQALWCSTAPGSGLVLTVCPTVCAGWGDVEAQLPEARQADTRWSLDLLMS